MMAVELALVNARSTLKAVTDVPALEAEILLSQVLHCSRSHLRAWPEKMLSDEEALSFERMVQRRAQGEPLAYLVGRKEFWSREFEVYSGVLVPRDDTETLIECVLAAYPEVETALRIADLGTGSGIIAITLQLERPHWEVHAVDISPEACACASKNAHAFGCKAIVFHSGSWCNALPVSGFDVIVSNPPYLSETEWPKYEAGLRYEPRLALVSGEDGLCALRDIIQGAKQALKPGGRLFLEHGFQQAEAVQTLLRQAGYVSVYTANDAGGRPRVTGASLSG